jgi:hypothetical protein
MSEDIQKLTAILAFLGMIFQGIMAYLMARLKIQQDNAAIATSLVRSDLKVSNDKHTTSLNETSAKVDTILKQTNGLTAALVKATGDASFAAGAKDQREKDGK